MPDENSNGGVQSNQSTVQNQSGNDFVLDFGDEEKQDEIISQENQESVEEENLTENPSQDAEFNVDINSEAPTQENSINSESETETEEKDSQDETFDISFDTDSDNEENKDNTEKNGENDSQSPMDDNESVEKSDEEPLKFDNESSEGNIDQPLEFTFDDNTVENDKPTEENKLEDDFSDSEELNQNPDENIEDGDNNLFKEDDKISADENINSEEDNNIYVEDKVDEKSNSEEENLNSEDLFEENDDKILNTNSDETTENLEENIVTDEENIEEKDIDDSEENETISFQNEEFTPDDSELNNTEENNGIVLDFDDEPSQNVGQIATGEVDNQENISESEEEKIVDDENIEDNSDESIQFNFAEDNLEDNENGEISDVNNNTEDIIEEKQSESDFVVDFNSEDNLQNNIEDNSEDNSQDSLSENEEQEPQIQPDIQTFEQEQDTFEGQASSQDAQSEIKQPEITDLLSDESTNIPSNEQNNQLPDDSESQSSDFTLSPSEDNKFEATVGNITQSGEISVNNEDNNTTIQSNSELQQNVPTVQPENNISSDINEQSFPQFQLDTDIINNQNNPQNNVNETVNNQPETIEMKSTLSLDQILDSELTNNSQFMNESKANPQNVVSNGGFFKKNLVGIVIGVSLFVLAGFVAILAFPSKTTERKTGDTVAIQTSEEGHFAGGDQEVEDGQDVQTENDEIIEEDSDYDMDYNTKDTQMAKSEIVFPDADGEDEVETVENEPDKIEPYHEDDEFNENLETNTNTITADEILEVISDFKSAAEKYYSQGDLLQDKKLIKYSLQAINICDLYKKQIESGEGISQEELDNFKTRITTSITKIETYMGGTEDIDLFVQDGSQDSYDFEGKEEVKNFIYDRANGLYQ